MKYKDLNKYSRSHFLYKPLLIIAFSVMATVLVVTSFASSDTHTSLEVESALLEGSASIVMDELSASKGSYIVFDTDDVSEAVEIIPEDLPENPAIGDGVVNDTAALQEAVNLSKQYPKSTVVLKNSYLISNSIVLSNLENITITGGGTIRISRESLGGTEIRSTIFSIRDGVKGLEISGLQLEAEYDRDSTHGLHGVVNVGDFQGDNSAVYEDILIRNNQFNNCASSALLLYGNKGKNNVTEVVGQPVIRDVIFEANNVNNCGFGIFAYKNVHSLSVIDNIITDTLVDGIVLDTMAATDQYDSLASTDSIIRGNKITNVGFGVYHSSIGILAKGQHNRLVIDGNTISNVHANLSTRYKLSQAYGILVNDDFAAKAGSDIMITNNTVDGVLTDYDDVSIGIRLGKGHTNIKMSKNTVTNTKGLGIKVDGVDILDSSQNQATFCGATYEDCYQVIDSTNVTKTD